MSFELATVARWWYIIGYYLAPDNTSTIESVVAALKERPRGAALLVAGYLNTTLTETGKRPKGNENRGDADGRRTWRHSSALPPAPAQMGQGTEDVEHSHGGEGRLVPDGLHPRDRPPYLLERVRLVPTAQNQSMYGAGLPSQRQREGTQKIPHRA